MCQWRCSEPGSRLASLMTQWVSTVEGPHSSSSIHCRKYVGTCWWIRTRVLFGDGRHCIDVSSARLNRLCAHTGYRTPRASQRKHDKFLTRRHACTRQSAPENIISESDRWSMNEYVADHPNRPTGQDVHVLF